MNIIFTGFIHPFIGILFGFLLIFGLELFGKNLLKKYFKTFFFLNLTTGLILCSLIAYIFILFNISKYLNTLIVAALIIFGAFNSHNCFKNFIFDHRNNYFFDYKKNFFVLLILFFLFILSISPPTMADSLSYHLGVAKFINTNHAWPDPNMWLHANLSGLGEVYNSLALIVFSDVAGSLIQFFALASFLYYFSNIITNKKKYIIFSLFILGSPVIVFLLSGSKFQIFPQLISTLILYFLIINKKINYNLSCLLLFLIFGIANFKLSFLLSGLILSSLLLTKSTINLKFILFSIVIFFIFFLPRAIFNLRYGNDISHLSFFVVAPEEFVYFLKNFKENNIIFPFNLFIPESFGKITTILGFQILILFLIKKIKRENIQIIILVAISSLFFFLFSQSIGRVYYEMILWLSLNLIFIEYFRIHLKYITYFLIANLSIVFFILIFSLYNLFPSLISNNYRIKIMKNNAYEFKGAEWINANISPGNIILSNLRSISLLTNETIPMDYLDYNIHFNKLNNYFNFLKKKKVNYIVIKNFTKIEDYFFKNCQTIYVKQSPNFQKETRNPLNRDLEYNITILELVNQDLAKCL